jgi:hypothetical protein
MSDLVCVHLDRVESACYPDIFLHAGCGYVFVCTHSCAHMHLSLYWERCSSTFDERLLINAN